MNPYASGPKKKAEEEKKANSDEEDDVLFNYKTNKIEVKDLEEDAKKANKPALFESTSSNKLGLLQKEETGNKKMLNKKRVKNVMRDGNDESDEDDYAKKKSRGSARPEKSKKTHVVKFSGEEYANKGGKGDKLLQGKYEPFAYIQLNPKAISKKKRKDNLEVFENLMKKK